MSFLTQTGLYLHVPFCSSKCNYCDFNSYDGKHELCEEYFNAMKKEIEYYHDEMKFNLIDTIFIGGGTPSCVEHKYISDILSTCRANFKISEGCEISIESNPGTLDIEKLKAYKNNGVNRISIGLQACQNNLLTYLGRKHSADDFISSIKLAKDAGINNINADVIFGIPEQTMEDWIETLKLLVDLGVTHISAYSLKIEEGTKFGHMLESGRLIQMDDELDRQMYHYTIDYLKLNGFDQYEISNFAKEGCQCKHNLTYWKCVDYLGLGAGAHSFFQDVRFSNEYSIEGYIKCLAKGEKPVEDRFTVDFNDKMSEYMFLGLRLTKGVSNSEFEDLFNQNMFKKYATIFNKLEKNQLIEIDGEKVKLTSLGLDLANQVFMEFV